MFRNKWDGYMVLIELLATALLFGGLLKGSLVDWDEAIYAQVAKEILTNGDWITLHWQSQPWFLKPPLYMWLTALTFWFFGIGEFTARLWSALFGLGTVICVYLLGRDLYGRRAGFLCALVLLISRQFLWFARMGMLDVTCAFFISSTLLLFWKGLDKDRYLVWLGLPLGLGILTKGVIGLFPVLIIACYLITFRQFRLLRKPQVYLGLGLALALVLPWYVTQYLIHGRKFIDEHFLQQVWMRATQTFEGHYGNPFFYVRVISDWSRSRSYLVFLLFAFIHLFRNVSQEKGNILVAWWFIAPFILFSLARTYLPWYIVPLYPAMAIAIGYFFNDFIEGKRTWPLLLGTTIGFTLVGLSIVQKVIQYTPAFGKIGLFPFALVSGVALLWLNFVPSRQRLKQFLVMVYIFTLMFRFLGDVKNLDFNPQVKQMAPVIKSVVSNSERLLVYESISPGVIFYSERFVELINEEIIEKLRSGRHYLLMRKEQYENLFSKRRDLRPVLLHEVDDLVFFIAGESPSHLN